MEHMKQVQDHGAAYAGSPDAAVTDVMITQKSVHDREVLQSGQAGACFGPCRCAVRCCSSAWVRQRPFRVLSWSWALSNCLALAQVRHEMQRHSPRPT